MLHAAYAIGTSLGVPDPFHPPLMTPTTPRFLASFACDRVTLAQLWISRSWKRCRPRSAFQAGSRAQDRGAGFSACLPRARLAALPLAREGVEVLLRIDLHGVAARRYVARSAAFVRLDRAPHFRGGRQAILAGELGGDPA